MNLALFVRIHCISDEWLRRPVSVVPWISRAGSAGRGRGGPEARLTVPLPDRPLSSLGTQPHRNIPNRVAFHWRLKGDRADEQ